MGFLPQVVLVLAPALLALLYAMSAVARSTTGSKASAMSVALGLSLFALPEVVLPSVATDFQMVSLLVLARVPVAITGLCCAIFPFSPKRPPLERYAGAFLGCAHLLYVAGILLMLLPAFGTPSLTASLVLQRCGLELPMPANQWRVTSEDSTGATVEGDRSHMRITIRRKPASKDQFDVAFTRAVHDARAAMPQSTIEDVPNNAIQSFRTVSGIEPSGTSHVYVMVAYAWLESTQALLYVSIEAPVSAASTLGRTAQAEAYRRSSRVILTSIRPIK